MSVPSNENWDVPLIIIVQRTHLYLLVNQSMVDVKGQTGPNNCLRQYGACLNIYFT